MPAALTSALLILAAALPSTRAHMMERALLLAVPAMPPLGVQRATRPPFVTLPAASRAVMNAAAEAQTPMKAEETWPKRKSDWRVLFSLCITDLPLLLAAFFALMLAATGDALLPQLQSEALNVLLYTPPIMMGATLRPSLLKLAAVGVLTAIFTGIRGFLFWLSGARLVKRLRSKLFGSLLAQPQSFYDTRGTGELSSRLNADCIKLSDVLSLNVNIVLRQIMQSAVRVLSTYCYELLHRVVYCHVR